MPQVLAWQSADGQLFTDKAQYQLHQRHLAAERRREQAAAADRAQFLTTMTQVCTLADLTQFVSDNWTWFTLNAAHHGVVPLTRVHPSLLYLEFAKLRWHSMISNSASSPVGTINFARSQEQPRNYPGWSGQIKFAVSIPRGRRFSPNFFSNTPIHLGCGGRLSQRPSSLVTWRPPAECDIYHYEYYITLWSADWPGLTQTHEKQMIWQRLSTPWALHAQDMSASWSLR